MAELEPARTPAHDLATDFFLLERQLQTVGEWPDVKGTSRLAVTDLLKTVCSGISVFEGYKTASYVALSPPQDNQLDELHSIVLRWQTALRYASNPRLQIVSEEVPLWSLKDGVYYTGAADVVLYDPGKREFAVADIKTTPPRMKVVEEFRRAEEARKAEERKCGMKSAKWIPWEVVWTVEKKLMKLRTVHQLGIYSAMLERSLRNLPESSPYRGLPCNTGYVVAMDFYRMEGKIFSVDLHDKHYISSDEITNERFKPDHVTCYSHDGGKTECNCQHVSVRPVF